MQPTRRKQLHETTREQIKILAWEQIERGGLIALSLGHIARQMGLTTPALYRYFSGRDALVAALVRDGYASLAEALETARDGSPAEDHAGRFRSMGLAYHAWAVTHPQQYLLLFGTPLPIREIDVEAGQAADRSFLILLEVIDAADRAGGLHLPPGRPRLGRDLKIQLEAVRHRDRSYSARVMDISLAAWSLIHGLTSLELNERYSLLLGERIGEYIELEITRFMQTIGLE